MKFNSIRHKFVLAVSLFITVLLSGIATLTYLYFRHEARELIFTQQFAMVTRVAHDLDNHLKQVHKSLIFVANSTPPTVVADSSAAEAWLRSQLTTRNVFFSSGMFILDATGVMRGADPARPRDYGTSFAERDYFITTMRSGTSQISAPVISREKKTPVIIMTAPIRGTDGSIAGVLCGRLDLLEKDNLFSSLNDVKPGSNGYLYLFARDRTMIMHPDPSRILKQDVKPGMNKMYDRALEGFEGSGETINSRGQRFLASFKRLQSADWILAANYPVDEAYQPIVRFRNYFLLAIIAALLATFGLVRKLGLGITRPLTAFTAQITDLARSGSDKRQRLDENRSDELGLLAASFNILMSDMQRREQERDLAIEASRAAEDRNELLLQSTDQGIYGTDAHGCFTYVNRAGLAMLGYGSEELVGKDSHRLIHHKHGDGSAYPVGECPISRANAAGTSCCVGNERLWRSDGSSFVAEMSLYPVFDNGVYRGSVVTFSDITEKKKNQEDIISARDKAEAATVAKSQFLATMSHEIRTPMNGVIGLTGLLLETELTDEQRGYAEIISRSGENLLSLINDILDFSKIEAGRLDLEITNFCLRSTIEDAAELLSLRAHDAGLELICHVDASVPEYLKGDPGRLRQIITNLAGNAIKFTHEGQVVIRAALVTSPPPNLPPLDPPGSEGEGENSLTRRGRVGEGEDFCVIRFSVHDTGIGIPQSRLAAIFEPFTQVDGSTTRKYGGTGLGLAICKQLTELMGGEIGIESEVGKGSTFWFTARFERQVGAGMHQPVSRPHTDIKGTQIPAVDDNAGNVTQAPVVSSALITRHTVEEIAGHGLRILLAEDNSINQKVAQSILGRLGYRADVAANGLEAVRALELIDYDIVLMDCMMPEMDGFAATAVIRDPGSHVRNHSVPIIAMTANAMQGDQEKCLEAGMDDYLAKPVKKDELAAILEKWGHYGNGCI
ncbi:MAG: ATP-binding protein [Desulfuromonadaceae bacterium]